MDDMNFAELEIGDVYCLRGSDDRLIKVQPIDLAFKFCEVDVDIKFNSVYISGPRAGNTNYTTSRAGVSFILGGETN